MRVRDGDWGFAYQARDEGMVNSIIANFNKASGSLGMKFEGEPQWIEIPDDNTLRNAGVKDPNRNGNNFIHCLNNDLRDSKG